MPVRFLTVAEVIHLHERGIEAHRGDPAIHDMGLLESAVATPQAAFGGEFLHPTIYEMAAAYAYHIARNHAFKDGNKRVASLSALAFLQLNGIRLDLDNVEYAQVILAVAEGAMTKAQLAEYFRGKMP